MQLKTKGSQKESLVPTEATINILKEIARVQEFQKGMSLEDYRTVYPQLASKKAELIQACGDGRKMMLVLENICNSKGNAYKDVKGVAALMYGFAFDFDFYIDATNKSSSGTLRIEGYEGIRRTLKFGLKSKNHVDLALSIVELEFEAHGNNHLLKARLLAEEKASTGLDEVNLEGHPRDQSKRKGPLPWDPERINPAVKMMALVRSVATSIDYSTQAPGYNDFRKIYNEVQKYLGIEDPSINDDKYLFGGLPGWVDKWLASPAGDIHKNVQTSQVIERDLDKTNNPAATLENFRNYMAASEWDKAFALLKKNSVTYAAFGVDRIKYGTVRSFISPADISQVLTWSYDGGTVLAKDIFNSSASASMYFGRSGLFTEFGDKINYTTLGLKLIGHIRFLNADAGTGINLVHFDQDPKLIGAVSAHMLLDKRLLTTRTFYAAMAVRPEYFSLFSPAPGQELSQAPGFIKEVPAHQDYADVKVGLKFKKRFPIYRKGEEFMSVSIYGAVDQRLDKLQFWQQIPNLRTLGTTAGISLEGIKAGPGTVKFDFSAQRVGFEKEKEFLEQGIRPQLNFSVTYVLPSGTLRKKKAGASE